MLFNKNLEAKIALITKQTIDFLKSNNNFDQLTPEMLHTIIWNTRKNNLKDLYNAEIDILVTYHGKFNGVSDELIKRACLFLEDTQEGNRFSYYLQRDVIEHTLSIISNYDDPVENDDEYERFYDELERVLIEDKCFEDEDAMAYDDLLDP